MTIRLNVPSYERFAFRFVQNKSIRVLEKYLARERQLLNLVPPEFHDEITGRIGLLENIITELRAFDFTAINKRGK